MTTTQRRVAPRSLCALVLLTFLASCDTESRRTAPDDATSPIAGDSTLPPATDEQSGSKPDPRILTPDGWGNLQVGMSFAEVVAAAGSDADPDAVGGPDPDTCDEFRPREAPVGVLVMIRNGTLTRISVSRTSGISTPTGFRVGDSGSSVSAHYGERALQEPHQYWGAPARYITVWRQSAGKRRGIRYEVDAADRVVHIRGGDESIEHIEGCV